MRPGTNGAGRLTLLVVVAGLLTGVVTLAGQSVLDAQWNRLANSGAIWLTVSFGVGSLMPRDRWAAIAGVSALVLAVVGYYVAASAVGAGVSMRNVTIWIATALVGGPAFGVAGHWWRTGEARRRVSAAALLGAVFVAEGATTVLMIPDLATTGWAEMGVGVVIPVVLLRPTRQRIAGLAWLVPLSALGMLAYGVIDRVFLGS